MGQKIDGKQKKKKKHPIKTDGLDSNEKTKEQNAKKKKQTDGKPKTKRPSPSPEHHPNRF